MNFDKATIPELIEYIETCDVEGLKAQGKGVVSMRWSYFKRIRDKIRSKIKRWKRAKKLYVAINNQAQFDADPKLPKCKAQIKTELTKKYIKYTKKISQFENIRNLIQNFVDDLDEARWDLIAVRTRDNIERKVGHH